METSASFEARSAPSPYPIANPFNHLRERLSSIRVTLPFSCLVLHRFCAIGAKQPDARSSRSKIVATYSA
jgi:hypothetical protein